MRNLFLGVVSLLVWGLAVSASAATVRVNYRGYVYHVTDSVSNQFSLGDKITGHISYSLDGTPNSNGVYNMYLGVASGGNLNVDGLNVKFGPSTRLTVSDDEPVNETLLIDRFIVEKFGNGPSVNGLPLYGAYLNWQDNSGKASRGAALPSTQAHFDAFNQNAAGAIDWVAGDAQNRVTFVLTEVNVAGVPEPSAWFMMLVGFVAVGCRVRTSRDCMGAVHA